MEYVRKRGYVFMLFADGTNKVIARRNSLRREEAEEYRQDYYNKFGRKNRITEIILCDDHYKLVNRYTYDD